MCIRLLINKCSREFNWQRPAGSGMECDGKYFSHEIFIEYPSNHQQHRTMIIIIVREPRNHQTTDGLMSIISSPQTLCLIVTISEEFNFNRVVIRLEQPLDLLTTSSRSSYACFDTSRVSAEAKKLWIWNYIAKKKNCCWMRGWWKASKKPHGREPLDYSAWGFSHVWQKKKMKIEVKEKRNLKSNSELISH